MQNRILGSFQKCHFWIQFSKSKIKMNCWYSSPRDVIFLMWRVWWKLENCFCFLWKQMFKMFKGAATDSLPGQFFPTGKTISLCLRWGFKMKVIVVTLYTKLLNSFEMLGKNTQKGPPSMLLDAWVFRKKQISDGDHHWEWCFVAAAVEISLSWIGRYPNMKQQSVKDILHWLLLCLLWYLTFFWDIKQVGRLDLFALCGMAWRIDLVFFLFQRLHEDFANLYYKFSRFKCH